MDKIKRTTKIEQLNSFKRQLKYLKKELKYMSTVRSNYSELFISFNKYKKYLKIVIKTLNEI